ncbi:GtrA-like protein [compost metagenome]
MTKQPIKFLIVGILNTIVGYSVYALYIFFIDKNYVHALLISHIIGVVHSYIWNRRWTFRQSHSSFGSIAKFVTIYIFTFLINLLLLSFFVDKMEVNTLVAQGIALFLTTLISYLGHKYWSFRSISKLNKECNND